MSPGQATVNSLANQTDSLVLLSEVFNYDFSQHSANEPLSDETLDSMTGLRGFLDRVVELSGTKNPTVDDFIRCSGKGTLSELPVFAGTPEHARRCLRMELDGDTSLFLVSNPFECLIVCIHEPSF